MGGIDAQNLHLTGEEFQLLKRAAQGGIFRMALLGFILVGVFAGAWALSALIYRLGGYDHLEIKAEA